MSTLGERLKELRGKRSGEAFAALLGVHLQTLYRYERGERKPDVDFIQLVASKTGVSLEWLIAGRGAAPGSGGEETAGPPQGAGCAGCAELKAELAQERGERRELAAENRQLWREYSEMKAELARLQERLRF